MNNKFLFIVIVVAIATSIATTNAYAQQAPPLEKSENATPPLETTFGKITIQISQTEQIVIDLPLKSENKYQVVPIK